MGKSSDLINRKAETYREYVTFTRKNRNENQEKNVFENIGSYNIYILLYVCTTGCDYNASMECTGWLIMHTGVLRVSSLVVCSILIYLLSVVVKESVKISGYRSVCQ